MLTAPNTDIKLLVSAERYIYHNRQLIKASHNTMTENKSLNMKDIKHVNFRRIEQRICLSQHAIHEKSVTLPGAI